MVDVKLTGIPETMLQTVFAISMGNVVLLKG